MMIKNFAKIFFIVDFGVIVFCVLSNNYIWLLNTQVAFVSSLFISIATFLSYKRNVDKRLQDVDYEAVTNDDRDKIDQIDDPFDLYSENEINETKSEYSKEEIQKIIKEEKSRIKQNSIKNVFLATPGFISLYRILGYAFLVFGFFALNNNGYFEPISYLVGLFIVPLSMFGLKLISK